MDQDIFDIEYHRKSPLVVDAAANRGRIVVARYAQRNTMDMPMFYRSGKRRYNPAA